MPLSKKEIASMEANDACMTCLEKTDKKIQSNFKILTPKRKFKLVKGRSPVQGRTLKSPRTANSKKKTA